MQPYTFKNHSTVEHNPLSLRRQTSLISWAPLKKSNLWSRHVCIGPDIYIVENLSILNSKSWQSLHILCFSLIQVIFNLIKTFTKRQSVNVLNELSMLLLTILYQNIQNAGTSNSSIFWSKFDIRQMDLKMRIEKPAGNADFRAMIKDFNLVQFKNPKSLQKHRSEKIRLRRGHVG